MTGSTSSKHAITTEGLSKNRPDTEIRYGVAWVKASRTFLLVGLVESNRHAAQSVVCVPVEVYYGWRPNLIDGGDNHVMELAIAGNAQVIVTHNTRDFQHGELPFPTIEILAPGERVPEEPMSALRI